MSALYFYTTADYILAGLSRWLGTQNISLPPGIIQCANMATELEYALLKNFLVA